MAEHPAPASDPGTAPAAALACSVTVRGVDLTLTVPVGRRLALVGPNGSGKSTALALLAGHLRPDSGEVHLHGERVSSGPGRGPSRGSGHGHVPAHRRRVVSLEQNPGLFPHLTALANVAYGPRSRGIGKRDALTRARAELDAVGCGGLADRRPHQLSGGQAQRVALARALAVDPEVVLLDEPLAALDVEVAPTMRRLLAERLTGRTVILVTHDPLDLWALAHDVAVLSDGHVVRTGTVEEVLARPCSEFVARLAGVSLLEGLVDDDATLRTSGGDAVAGLRSDTATGADSEWRAGVRAVATIDSRAVAVHAATVAEYPITAGGTSTASPRNSWPARVVGLAPAGALTRVTTELRDGQRVDAEITSRSAADLALAPGVDVLLVVKATQVALYARPLVS